MLAAFEVAVAATALAVGGRGPALALAAVYVGFDVFILWLLRLGPVPGCGCFGVKENPPPGPVHLVTNAAFALAAVGFAFADQPVGADADLGPVLVVLGLGVLGAWLVYLADTLLPQLRVRA